MGDIFQIMQALSGTAVPNILLLLGSILIVLGFVGKVSTVVEMKGLERAGALIFGLICFTLGIGLYLLSNAKFSSMPTDSIATATPVPVVAIDTPSPTFTPLPPTACQLSHHYLHQLLYGHQHQYLQH